MNKYLLYSDAKLAFHINEMYPNRPPYRGSKSEVMWVKAFITYRGYFPDLDNLNYIEKEFKIPKDFIPIEDYTLFFPVKSRTPGTTVDIEESTDSPIYLKQIVRDGGEFLKLHFKCSSKSRRFYVTEKDSDNNLKKDFFINLVPIK